MASQKIQTASAGWSHGAGRQGRSLLCSLTVLLSSFAVAAQTADVERFRTPMTTDGLLATESTLVLLPSQWSAATTLHFAHNPIVWRYGDNSYEPVVGRQLILDVVVAAGLFDHFDLGLAIPFALLQRGPESPEIGKIRGAGVGDLRLLPRIAILDDRSWPLGLAFVCELTFPTGDEGRFLGEPNLSWRPRLVASILLHPIVLLGSVGYRVRENAWVADMELADEIDFHVGAELALTIADIAVDPMLELSGTTAAVDPLGPGQAAMEVLAGIRAQVVPNIRATLGAGVGLTRGVGVPSYRLLLGFAFAPSGEDTDGDGLPDFADDCPAEPEDFDRHQDSDGCPDPDNDGDGFLDAQDQCPDEAEDFNQHEDDDGCPDSHTVDSDDDGVMDSDDPCPLEPEDLDEFEDDDGCPEWDNDQDGISDEQDQCPDDKETINGIDDHDGCPDEGEGQTEYIASERIEIKETILFKTGRSTIKARSKAVLDQVALQILSHPGIARVLIEGHTDNVGPAEDNLFLSVDRADAVRRYLSKRGVPANRLEAAGFGETRPLETNSTARGRARNRRVEFIILDDE